MAAPRSLRDCLNIDDLRALAERRLPAPVYPHLVGAAEDEITARRNVSAFDDAYIVPRVLTDVSEVKTATRVLGQDLSWPVYCSPTGSSRLFHAEGEGAVARACAKTGTLYALSTVATTSMEEVAASAPGPKLFQLFIFKDRGLTRDLIARAKAAGFSALCLTVDTPARGNCEREARAGVATRYSPSGIASFMAHPAWTLAQLRAGSFGIPAVAAASGGRSFWDHSRYVGEALDCSIGWGDVAEVAKLWNGPFAVKGVMAAADARRAADAGATAVIVSNHGGRQLDGAAASFEVLPRVADAVGERVEVLLDGGVRRGVHVLKALSRGARAVGVGRPYLYGLAAGGEAGVVKALDILRRELVTAMRMSGVADVRTVDASLLLDGPEPVAAPPAIRKVI